jgi:glucosamine-6-phosphate deaminase
MKINIFDSKKELYDAVALYFIDKVKSNPEIHLGLATGSTPVPLYERLIIDHKVNHTSYKKVKSFNLDEYIGLPRTHEQSYYTFMNNNLFKHIDITETYIPNGEASDILAEAKSYKELLEREGVDLQILGIGSNGHIGFNEPNTPFDSHVHIVDLAESTIKDNARFFEGNLDLVPKKAITMGIKDIMAAKEIVLIATGKAKSKAINEVVNGKVDTFVPATILQKHPNVHLYLDKDAASKL